MQRYIVITNLPERLSSPGFSNEVENGMSLSMYSYYTCACGQRIRFNKSDLENAERSPQSLIGEEDRIAIEAAAKNFLKPHDAFLDLFCPNCKKPIRLYFHSWAGGKHGDSGMEWRFIVEKN